MTYHPSRGVKYLRNGDARLTTHMLWTAFAEVLEKMAPFKTGGALYGERAHWQAGAYVGRLDKAFQESVATADYVVYSYQTPIAWHVPVSYEANKALPLDSDSWKTTADVNGGAWVEVFHKYSATTSQHQSTIATAISTLNRR